MLRVFTKNLIQPSLQETHNRYKAAKLNTFKIMDHVDRCIFSTTVEATKQPGALSSAIAYSFAM